MLSFNWYCYNFLILEKMHQDLRWNLGLVWNLVMLLCVWAYFKTAFTSPGTIPKAWRARAQTENVGTTCRRCVQKRPLRAHHCSLCDTCVMRMDHHCPWVANCVGFENHKFFVQFCVYTFLACLLYLVTLYREIRVFMGLDDYTILPSTHFLPSEHLLVTLSAVIAISFGLGVAGTAGCTSICSARVLGVTSRESWARPFRPGLDYSWTVEGLS